MAKIPQLLEPIMRSPPPESALVVVTSVLGASANWLVLRWAYALLQPGRESERRRREQRRRGAVDADGDGVGEEDVEGEGDGGRGGEDVAVVLVSFMRDLAFWREGAARLGLDLDAHGRNGRFVFVDGLSGLFTPAAARPKPKPGATAEHVLCSSRLDDVRRGIEAGMASVRAGCKAVLVIDQLDVLLAAAATADKVSSLTVQNMLLSLRERAHATVLTMAADEPLVHRQTTALEREHAALVLGQAHAARCVVALRMLDTGAARDVSGVVRVSVRNQGGGHDDDGFGAGLGRADGEDVEYLYYVAGDGAVKVFERGA